MGAYDTVLHQEGREHTSSFYIGELFLHCCAVLQTVWRYTCGVWFEPTDDGPIENVRCGLKQIKNTSHVVSSNVLLDTVPCPIVYIVHSIA